MAGWDDAPAAGGLGECADLVRSAEALRFSAPELAVQLARRALEVGAESAKTADIGQAKALSMRGQAVLAAGLVRMSHYTDAVEPAFAALALAESEGAGEVAVAVRLDLAACSRELGEPLLGCGLLRPVLETAQPNPSVRAVALGRLVGCIAHVGRRDDLEDALAEADRLLSADDGLGSDERRMERARLSVRAAAYYRWYGDTEDAADAAREGLTQLNRLRGSQAETSRLRAQLVLELACALLDEGSLEEAASVSEAMLAEPVRATSAAAVGRLMLAVSTRVHFPSGRVDRGRGLLDQAVWVADRHGLDDLLADALTAVSRLDEKAGRPVEALESLQMARAAEQRRQRALALAARRLLTETNAAKWNVRTANALLRKVLRGAPDQPAPASAPASAPPSTSPSTLPSTPASAPASAPAHEDWRVAAQRVIQPRQQPAARTVPALQPMDQPAEERTTPVEQPAGETPAAAHAGGRGDGDPTGDRAATGQSGEQPVVASWPAKEVAALWPAAPAKTAEPAADPAAEAAAAEPEVDGATGLLSKEGLIRRLSAARNGDRPVALTLVRLDGPAGSGRFADPGTRPGAAAEFELSELAGRVRTIAPEGAELARSDGMELAVLLPRTTRDEAKKFAAEVESTWLRDANGQSISTGVVQSDPDATTVDARALIDEARHALTQGGSRPDPDPVPRTMADLADIDDVGDTLRIGREIIRSLSIPEGSGGKRRATDAGATDAPADVPAAAGAAADAPVAARPTEARPGDGQGDVSPEEGTGVGEPVESPTYEQTKADLARMILELTAAKDAEPAPDPGGPSEATTRNGTALPRQSIPTPPDPDEIPEPEPHPDIPDPDEPTPIPPPPPEPGPESPGEPGPLTPPSVTTPETTGQGSAGLAERPILRALPGERTTQDTDRLPRRGESHRADGATAESLPLPRRLPSSRTGGESSRAGGEPSPRVGNRRVSNYADAFRDEWTDKPHRGQPSNLGAAFASRKPLPRTEEHNGAQIDARTDAQPGEHGAWWTDDQTTTRDAAENAASTNAHTNADAGEPTGRDTSEQTGRTGEHGARWTDGNTAAHDGAASTASTSARPSAPAGEPAGLDTGEQSERTAARNGSYTASWTDGQAAARDGAQTATSTSASFGAQPAAPTSTSTSTHSDAPIGTSTSAHSDAAVGTSTSTHSDAAIGTSTSAHSDAPIGTSTSTHSDAAIGTSTSAHSDAPIGTSTSAHSAATSASSSASTSAPTSVPTGASTSAPTSPPASASTSPPISASTSAPTSRPIGASTSVSSSAPAKLRADRRAGEPTGVRTSSYNGESHRTERRAERSSGSTTIAGLLAEALAAYQENSDEPEPAAEAQPAAKTQPASDSDFDRLFDWRYQSPASGRHRSPE